MLATIGDLLILVIAIIILAFVVTLYVNSTSSSSTRQITSTNCDVALMMQKLWLDHYYYTRMAIIEYVSGYPGATETINRLYRNQQNIGSYVGTFAGAETGNELTALLTEHIDIALQIVKAASTGADITSMRSNWNRNAYQIAALIHKVLPSSSLDTLEQSLIKHLDTTIDEATAIINKNYGDSIVKGDIAEDHIIAMSNYISSFL